MIEKIDNSQLNIGDDVWLLDTKVTSFLRGVNHVNTIAPAKIVSKSKSSITVESMDKTIRFGYRKTKLLTRHINDMIAHHYYALFKTNADAKQYLIDQEAEQLIKAKTKFDEQVTALKKLDDVNVFNQANATLAKVLHDTNDQTN